jgi:hypothetical protein
MLEGTGPPLLPTLTRAACENISAGSTIVIQLSQDSNGAIQLSFGREEWRKIRDVHDFM